MQQSPLVEQCDGVAAYRPLLGGHASGGVKQELLHHADLVKAEVARAVAVVLHPDKDEREWNLSMLKNACSSWVTNENFIRTDDVESFVNQIDLTHVDRILGSSNVTQAGNELETIVTELGGSLRPSGGGALGGEAARELLNLKRRLAQSVLANLASYTNGLEGENGFEIVREDMTPHEFSNKILSAVN